jgi:hypothetical protein
MISRAASADFSISVLINPNKLTTLFSVEATGWQVDVLCFDF